MSSASSSGAAWYTRLEPAEPPDYLPRRPDDPRLGECVEFWRGGEPPLSTGRAVIVGFPQDDGVRRNRGRPGAAEAPRAIRRFLFRATSWDGLANVSLVEKPPLDLGDVRAGDTLERNQEMLGQVVAAILQAGAVPIVLGGGHETAYGHYLGYVQDRRRVGIINFDAHLDLRPCLDGLGHSGSPFRQALEHPTMPLSGPAYVCIGAQPHSVSREHWSYARLRRCRIHWAPKVWWTVSECFGREIHRLAKAGCRLYVTVDADVVRSFEVPGVSAPSSAGLIGDDLLECARIAGRSDAVSSFDLVEINPRFDRDDQSSRWGALVIWNFLVGLAQRVAK